ncbi:MAG TPA: PucR family transcriptional regulator ligand-binding domain-containing protein [Solirubrobacteraceae bacterium]|nr:PucR family transcriptional regulator ligand-binding domain-containing protein [Solirubrobacteraceae bacterium]
MLTVRELLRDLDVRLVAGEGSLNLPVRWVHISEILDPTPWLSGGELLLTTGMQLDTPTQAREYAVRLADHHLAGLGFGTGFKHPTVPEALLEVAAEREFPVFEVPYELPFIAITEAAFTQLVNEQYAVLRRALAAQERLERLVLSERGLEALVSALATLIGAAVVVFDSRGEPLQQHAFRREIDPVALQTLRGEVRERARRREARAFVPSLFEGNQGLALPVAADGAPRPERNGSAQGGRDGVRDRVRPPEAWLVAVKDAGPLSDFDRLTLHQAVTIVALELLRSRVAGDTERRLAGDVLDAIVSGELSGSELGRRLGPFGLSDRVAAIVLGRDGDARISPASLEAALWSGLREEATPALVASVGQLACALVAGGPDEELFALGDRVAAVAERELDSSVRVGIGRAMPTSDARRSFHEARCAMEALGLGVAASANGNGSGSTSGSRPRVATYKDLGSFQLLLSLQDEEALRLFCDSILGPIEASEGPYGGELMRSLEAFIEENGQWERAAKRLYCHRHTLRYRIRRVEELTGRNLSSARDRIEFWLALRGRQLVA